MRRTGSQARVQPSAGITLVTLPLVSASAAVFNPLARASALRGTELYVSVGTGSLTGGLGTILAIAQIISGGIERGAARGPGEPGGILRAELRRGSRSAGRPGHPAPLPGQQTPMERLAEGVHCIVGRSSPDGAAGLTRTGRGRRRRAPGRGTAPVRRRSDRAAGRAARRSGRRRSAGRSRSTPHRPPGRPISLSLAGGVGEAAT